MYVRNDVDASRVEELHEVAQTLYERSFEINEAGQWDGMWLEFGTDEYWDFSNDCNKADRLYRLAKLIDRVADALTPF